MFSKRYNIDLHFFHILNDSSAEQRFSHVFYYSFSESTIFFKALVYINYRIMWLTKNLVFCTVFISNDDW